MRELTPDERAQVAAYFGPQSFEQNRHWLYEHADLASARARNNIERPSHFGALIHDLLTTCALLSARRGARSELAPLDLSTLDPGIRRTVALLRLYGFHTTDSGDGSTKLEGYASSEHAAEDGILDFPHVAIRVQPPEALTAEADRLARVLRDAGVELGPQGPEVGTPHIEATYDPCDGIAMLFVSGVCDSLLGEVSNG